MDMKKAVSLLRAFHRDDEQVIAQIRAITTAEWNNILAQLKLLGLAPLFYSHLANNTFATVVPAYVLQVLLEEYYLHGARNTIILDDLCNLLKALRPSGIDAIVLKGACLAEMVYGDIALRPMQDIDILVRRKDLEDVEQVLIGMGYGPAERPPVEEQCRMHHHLIPFTRPGSPTIEVHWSLTPSDCRFPMAMEDLWEKTREVHFNEFTARMLCPVDLLTHLCLHICTNHRFSILEIKNLYDIAQVLRHYGEEIDWKMLGESTRRFGVGKYVYSTLLVAEKLFGAVLQPEGLAWLDHDDKDTKIVDIVADYLLDTAAIPLPDVFGQMSGRKSLLQSLGALFHRLFPPYDYLARKYGILHSEAPSRRSLYLRHWMEALTRGMHLLLHMSLMSKKARATVTRIKQALIIDDWLKSGSAAQS